MTGPVDPAQAAAKAAAVTKSASSSFYWAMRLMPAEKRAAMFAVYAFCRVVDDIADEAGPSAGERRERLEEWRGRIRRLYAGGTPQEEITAALAPAIERFGLKRDDFLAVIDGMEMDAAGPLKAPSMEELDLYCDRVASAVGRLSVRIFGETTERGLELAHHQGRALQLANILRDVAEDARAGRLYLPRELLEKHRIAWEDPQAVMGQPGFPPLWRELAEIAAEHFGKARALLSRCAADMRPARIMLEIYARNLARMQALTDARLADPSVGKRLVGQGEKLRIALGIWARGKAR